MHYFYCSVGKNQHEVIQFNTHRPVNEKEIVEKKMSEIYS